MPNAPLVSKTELQNLVAKGLAHESFEHTECGIFDVTVMRGLSPVLHQLGLIERITTDLPPIVALVKSSRDFEEARVKALTEESYNDPGILIQMDDGTSLLVDGTHRVIRRDRDGESIMRFYLWPIGLAEIVGRPDFESFGVLDCEWGDPDYWKKQGTARPEFGREK